MTPTRRTVLAGAMAGALSNGPAFAAVSADDVIEAQGDSLTAGTGSQGDGDGQGPYPLQLQRRLSRRYGRVIPVINRGVGGVNARTCAARSNGQPMRFSVQGDALPSEGPAVLTTFDANPIIRQAPEPLTGTYAGLRGTLAATGFTAAGNPTGMTFTRARPGPPIAVAPMSALLTDLGEETRRHVKLMVYGRNGQEAASICAAIDGDIAHQDGPRKRWLVGSVMTAADEIGTPAQARIRALNHVLRTRYGDNYVDLDSPPTAAEMHAIGFQPERGGPYPKGHTDLGDIAAGVIPSGMRMGGPSFNQHLNNLGYALWALRFDLAISKTGWFG